MMKILRWMVAVAALCAPTVFPPEPAVAGKTSSSITYTTSLSGKSADPATASAATGRAQVRIDTTLRRVSILLTIKGIKIEDLRQDLLRSKMGPIHLHRYFRRADGTTGVALVMAVPYSESYRLTKQGFIVELKSIDFVQDSKLVGSTTPFDEFVKSMDSGDVLLNIHTTRFPDGEISGRLKAIGRTSGPDARKKPGATARPSMGEMDDMGGGA